MTTRSSASALLHRSIAEGFEETGYIKKAIEEYRHALKLDQNNYSYLYSLACCLYEENKFDEAKEYFIRSYELIEENQQI